MAAAALAAQAARLRASSDKVGKGNDGELLIGGLLDELRQEGWYVLRDRRKSRTSPANLDHVVVGPPGVVVVDAKNWTGGLLRLDERGMAVGRWRKDNELHSAKVDADIVREVAAAAAPGVACVGLLAFVNDMGISEPMLHRDVVVVQREQLLPWLRSLPAELEPSQVTDLGRHLDDRLPPRAGSAVTVGAPRVPQQWARPAAVVSAQERAAERDRVKKQKKQAKAKAEFRSSLVRLGIVAVVGLSLPVTFPLAQMHVLQPIADRFAQSFAENLEQPPPAGAPAPAP